MIPLTAGMKEYLKQRGGHIQIALSSSGELIVDYSFAPATIRGAAKRIAPILDESDLTGLLRTWALQDHPPKKEQLRAMARATLKRRITTRQFNSAYKDVFHRARGRPPLTR